MALVWTLYQTLEPVCDLLACFFFPFHASFKTCFLFWLFFARSRAATCIIRGFLQPLVTPYEGIIDSLMAAALSFFFNAVFLLSLPLAWVASHVRLGAARFKKYLLGWTDSSSARCSQSGPLHGEAVSKASRMPPPARRKPLRSSGADQLRNWKGLTHAHVPSGVDHSKKDDIAVYTSAETREGVKIHGESRKSPYSGTTASVYGFHESLAHRSSTILAALDSPPFVPSSDPSYTRTQGASGGFAFIPSHESVIHYPSCTIIDKAASTDEELPLDPFTPSLLPGGFGLPHPQVVAPKIVLKMPKGAKARARKTKSSVTASLRASAVDGRSDLSGSQRKVGRDSLPRAKESPLFPSEKGNKDERMDSDAPKSENNQISANLNGQSSVAIRGTRSAMAKSHSKRRRVSPSTTPTYEAPADKRTKLAVFEDDNAQELLVSAANAENSDAPVRRTRSALASRDASRTNSVAPRTSEDQQQASKDFGRPKVTKNATARSRLPRSTTNKAVRKTPLSTLLPISGNLTEEATPAMGAMAFSRDVSQRGKEGAATESALQPIASETTRFNHKRVSTRSSATAAGALTASSKAKPTETTATRARATRR